MVPFLLEKNMEKLPTEIWLNHRVIPVLIHEDDKTPCRMCVFNSLDIDCGPIDCTVNDREDKKDVYFVAADDDVFVPQQKYNDTEKRTLANSAAVIIHSTYGKVLTTTRRNTDILALPGGKQDPGESILDAAVRETAEETGLHLKSKDFIPIFSEIVVGADGRDFYCTTYVYKTAIDETVFADSWFVEDGIKVSFQTWENLYTGAFVEYNKKAEQNFRRWQAAQ
jgi:8-oxo-dGTP pyrophosphatase MutT (NUDIX family)